MRIWYSILLVISFLWLLHFARIHRPWTLFSDSDTGFDWLHSLIRWRYDVSNFPTHFSSQAAEMGQLVCVLDIGSRTQLTAHREEPTWIFDAIRPFHGFLARRSSRKLRRRSYARSPVGVDLWCKVVSAKWRGGSSRRLLGSIVETMTFDRWSGRYMREMIQSCTSFVNRLVDWLSHQVLGVVFNGRLA